MRALCEALPRTSRTNAPSAASGEQLRRAFEAIDLDGTLLTLTHPKEFEAAFRDKRQRKSLMGGSNLRRQFGAIGATVRVVVNCVKHTLSFSVNDGPSVEAGIRLPAAVAPFVTLAHEGDAVSLSEYERDALAAPSEWQRDEARGGDGRHLLRR